MAKVSGSRVAKSSSVFIAMIGGINYKDFIPNMVLKIGYHFWKRKET
jgi:hypothetical protein